jgi:hypothetical protein
MARLAGNTAFARFRNFVLGDAQQAAFRMW